MESNIDKIIGQQDQHYLGIPFVHFIIQNKIPNPKNALVTNSFTVQRIRCDLIKSYDTLEELLSDKNLIPENIKKSSIQDLHRFVAVDSGRDRGIEYDNFVAFSSPNNPMDRPVAKMLHLDGTVKYYPNPEISKLVKRK